MPRLFLTPFVIAGLLFLPSCSSEEYIDSSDCNNIRGEFIELSKKFNTEIDIDRKKIAALTYIYYGLGNEECFSPETIATLKAYLATLQK